VTTDDGVTPSGGARTAAPFISNAPKLGYCPPLDGLRGISVSLIILVHASFVPFGSFAATVDIFFAVSGFLITTLLLEEDRRSGRVNLRRFYARRALRLLPLLYVVLVGTLLAAAAVQLVSKNSDILSKAVGDVLAGGTYTYHVFHPVHQELVGGGPPEIRPLLHLWSLSVEEHFYIIGVAVVLIVVRKRWVTQACILFLAIWIGIGIARFTGHVGPFFAWYQRPESLLIGVALAFVNARLGATLSDRFGLWLRRGAWIALALMGVTVFLGTFLAKPFGLFIPFLVEKGGSLTDGMHWSRFGFTIVSGSISVIILAVARFPQIPIARFLSWKPFTVLGVRSYAIYLLHVPIGVVMMDTLGKKVPALALLLYLPVLAVAVEVCHRFVEKPALKIKLKLAEPGASGAGR
jgi:peptidoglycan/LPS O-acetylase OafA/YrhL